MMLNDWIFFSFVHCSVALGTAMIGWTGGLPIQSSLRYPTHYTGHPSVYCLITTSP